MRAVTDYTIRANSLQIGAVRIDFPHPILKTEPFDDRLIIVLAIPADSNDTDNVYMVSRTGEILWQIQSRDAMDSKYLKTPYVGVFIRDDCIQVNDFYGARYLVDPRNGAIIGRNRSGRDW